MDMAPRKNKKKYEYFNEGRGIADLYLSDSRDGHSEESNSPRPYSYYDESPSGSSTRHSSPIQEPSSPDFHTTTTLPQLPPFASQSSLYPQSSSIRDFSHQGTSMVGPYSFREVSDSSYDAYSETSSGYGSLDPLTYRQASESSLHDEEAPLTYTIVDDDDRYPKNPKSQALFNFKGHKRPQRCKMCANHNRIVNMKGHEWLCEYKNCPCPSCDITRKTQYYMKDDAYSESSSGYGSLDPLTYRQGNESSIHDEEGPSSTQAQYNSKGQKRPQRCRMCANHNEIVDMKGHKWYCKYRDCTCDHCDITRKTQYYMKERQKLTRHQQQQQQTEDGDAHVGVEASGRRRVTNQGTMDFPRVQEMVEQTSDILDYSLFERVNLACRPKSSSNLQQ